MLLFLRNFGGIFQRRMNSIMSQNIIPFSFPLQKLNVANAYIQVKLIDTGIISNYKKDYKKDLPYLACSIIPNS